MILSEHDLSIDLNGTYFISIPQNSSLGDLLANCHVNSCARINVNEFPVPSDGLERQPIELVELMVNKNIRPESLMNELQNRSLRPATLPETLAVLITCAREGGSFSPGPPLICLASPCSQNGIRHFPEVNGEHGAIEINLMPVQEFLWGHYLLFAFQS